MGKHRRSFSSSFKAKVALEAIKGQRTVQEISSTFQVHPNQVTQWKRQALELLPAVFSSDHGHKERAADELRDELYQQIGRLQMELEWLKKKSGL